MSITPFENESEALSLGGLNVENRFDRVSLFGSLDLTKDKAGLAHALSLKAVIDAIVVALESETNLPDEVELPASPSGRRDPFA